MQINFSKAFLLSGKDYPLTSFLTLRQPTVDDVLSISGSPAPDRLYWMYVQLLLSDPYAHMVMLDDMGKNYLEVSPFEVFTLQWGDGEETAASIEKALQLFITGEHLFTKGSYEDGGICFYDVKNPSCQINQEIFECLLEWIRAIHKLDSSNQIQPADENARRILIDDMRREIKKAKKQKPKKENTAEYLGSLMSAVCFCTNASITPFNIRECKLYWLKEALSISSKKADADHLLDGIYHGTISSKDINKGDLDWIN